MKKLLILILTVCSIAGYGQTQMNPSGSNSVANINIALTMPAVASGTDTYTTTIIGATLTTNKGYTILFTNACTGTPTPTININDGTNNLGAITLKKYSSGSLVNLSSGDISNGETKRFRYNGTNFVMEGGSGSGGGGDLLAANNLSDLTNASTARTNLGLGTLSTQNGTSPSGTIVGTSDTQTLTNKTIAAGSNTISGLTNSNLSGSAGISDANISSSSTWNAKQSAITFGTGIQTALGINIGSAGAPVLFNGSAGQPSSINLLNGTALPESGVTNLTTDLSAKAPLASPALTGTPTAPTATLGTNTTQIATTAFANAAIAASALGPADATHDGYTSQTDWNIWTSSATSVRSAALGGTGLSSYAIGDLIYASATTPTLAKLAAVATGSVLGSAGTNTAPAYLAVSNGLTATSSTLKWGGSLTGATTITMSTSNTLKFIADNTGTTITPGAGLWIANTTAATNGAQQASSIIISGNGFNTTGSTSGTNDWNIENLPVQNTTQTGSLLFQNRVNGGAFVTAFSITSSGAASSTYGFTSGANIQSPTSTMIFTGQNAATTGFQFNHAYNSIASNGISVDWTQGFSPTSGTTTWKGMRFSGVINQTGGANGATTMIDAIHTLTSASGNHTFLHYKPTETSIASHYFITSESTTALSSLGGVASPTAYLHLGASVTANASLRIAEGVAPTSPNAGDIWNESTNHRLMFRQNATSVEFLGVSAVNSVSPTAQNRTITVVINGTTYYITAKTTND